MGNLAQWKAQIEQWQQDEELIIKTRHPLVLDVTSVKIRCCAYCGDAQAYITRHHKGHEYLWARLLPKRYARRYIEFRERDVVELCNKHHLKIHKLYEPRLHSLWPLLARQDGKITFKQAESYRLKLVRCCEQWLKKGKK